MYHTLYLPQAVPVYPPVTKNDLAMAIMMCQLLSERKCKMLSKDQNLQNLVTFRQIISNCKRLLATACILMNFCPVFDIIWFRYLLSICSAVDHMYLWKKMFALKTTVDLKLLLIFKDNRRLNLNLNFASANYLFNLFFSACILMK